MIQLIDTKNFAQVLATFLHDIIYDPKSNKN